jgi:hypothetical protein
MMAPKSQNAAPERRALGHARAAAPVRWLLAPAEPAARTRARPPAFALRFSPRLPHGRLTLSAAL